MTPHHHSYRNASRYHEETPCSPSRNRKDQFKKCKLERHKQRLRRDNQVLLHMPRITEQPTKLQRSPSTRLKPHLEHGIQLERAEDRQTWTALTRQFPKQCSNEKEQAKRSSKDSEKGRKKISQPEIDKRNEALF